MIHTSYENGRHRTPTLLIYKSDEIDIPWGFYPAGSVSGPGYEPHTDSQPPPYDLHGQIVATANVPEPATMVLAGMSAMGFVLFARQTTRRARPFKRRNG